jgi:hypothetical protein
MFVVLELLQVEKVASVMTSAEYNVAACRVVAESSKHFLQVLLADEKSLSRGHEPLIL